VLSGEFMTLSKSWLDCKYLICILIGYFNSHFHLVESLVDSFCSPFPAQQPVVLHPHQPPLRPQRLS
jgi:hypothetical protein